MVTLGEIADARAAAAAARVAARTAAFELTAAIERYLAVRGVDPDAAAAAADEVRSLRGRAATAEAAAERAADRVTTLRDGLVDRGAPERGFGDVDGRLPVALLPVRIETRFVGALRRRELRVRLFPDDVHVHTHETELTDIEVAAGRRWLDHGRTTAAWRELVDRFGAPRAAWIARVVEAGDTSARRPSPWTRAPRAVALPDRFAVAGFRDGRRRFLVWGAPIPDDLAVGPAPDPTADLPDPFASEDGERTDDPAGDPGLRWLVDYDEAVRVGMAVTVPASAILAGGQPDVYDRILAVGVDWTRTPEQAAAALAGLLDAQRFTEGVGVVPAGTPTNNTSATVADGDGDGDDAVTALDPTRPDPPDDPELASRRLGRALGLAEPRHLDRIAHATRVDDGDAAAMQTLLWEATWGYFLDQMMAPLVTDTTIAAVRDHAVAYLRGRGPLPTVRVGPQPYGVLPVVAPDRWEPRGELERRLGGLLGRTRGFWERAADDAPRLGRTSDLSADLLDLLQSTPVSGTVRFRNVFGPLLVANAEGLRPATAAQEAVARWIEAMVLDRRRPRLGTMLLRPGHDHLAIPLVQAGPASETDPLEPDHLSELLELLGRDGGFAQLRRRRPGGQTLLRLLVEHAAQLQVARAAADLIGGPRPVANRLAREPELIGISTARPSGPPPVAVAEQPHAPISGARPMADHLATAPDLAEHPATRPLAAFRAALARLAPVPTAELERLLVETLDCAGTRFDAWQTSLAARRLDEVRALHPTGVHLGAFGWVEDLRPGTEPDSVGYVHAPSLRHAATAAVLRAGHLTHPEHPEVLAIDLSSTRVRQALTVLDGVRTGVPLGRLLGYRFERGLRERDPRLARHLPRLRRLAPAPDLDDGEVSGQVVDGLALLDAWRESGGTAGFVERPLARGSRPVPPVPPSDRPAIAAEVAELERLLDAIGDILVAEAVHQMVGGNPDRAAAAMAALDRQGPPPDPEVVRTPRSGTAVLVRVVVLLGEGARPSGWAGAPADAEAEVEPGLDAWVAALLGDPDRIRLSGALRAAGDGEPGEPVAGSVEVDVLDLDRSPLGMVLDAPGGALRTRIDGALTARAPDGTVVVPGAAVDAFVGRCEAIARLVSGARPADATAFLRTTEPLDDPGHDAAAFADRRDEVAERLGPGVPVLPRFRLPAAVAAEVAAALADQDALLGGDALAATTWADRLGLVRGDLGRLVDVLVDAEVRGGPGLDQLAVVQRPHVPGATWVGLPHADDPTADLAVAVHAPHGLDPAGELHGLVVDEWTDLLPGPTETTGVAFHYDAPGARPPQAILLAVPPDPDAAAWDLDALLGTVNEALDLARLRAVDPQRLSFTGRYLPAIYLPANALNETASVDLHHARADEG